MTTLTPWQIELIPWHMFGAYWAITWLRVKRTKTAEKSADRLATVVVLVMPFVLLFDNRLRMGPLGWRFVPAENWIVWAGILLTSLGVAVAIWARHCLGQYWSARVTLKEGINSFAPARIGWCGTPSTRECCWPPPEPPW
jgi:protein-S-isoprenylcysteine O-methyltransferase Ste14